MRRVIRITTHDNCPLGWVEVGKTIFAFNQNLSAGEEFKTTEEAVNFVSRGFTNVKVIDVRTQNTTT